MFEWRNNSCHTAHRIHFHHVLKMSRNHEISPSLLIYTSSSSGFVCVSMNPCAWLEHWKGKHFSTHVAVLLLRSESTVVKPINMFLDFFQLHQWIRSLSNGCAATLTSRSSSPAGKTQAHFLRQMQDALCWRLRFGIQIPWDGHASPPSTGNIGIIDALF